MTQLPESLKERRFVMYARAVTTYIMSELEKGVRYMSFIERKLVQRGLPVSISVTKKIEEPKLIYIVEVDLSNVYEALKRIFLGSEEETQSGEENEHNA